MRTITVFLLLLIVALQWPVWLGKGGWYRVWQINHTLDSQRATNARLAARNAALAAEVNDLKTGTDAIEERARSELGMIKKGEVFFQILEKNTPAPRVNPSESHEVLAADGSAPAVR